jgi:hypothetical protein
MCSIVCCVTQETRHAECYELLTRQQLRRRCSMIRAMTFITTATTKRTVGSIWTEAARRPACLCGRQILAVQDVVLRTSAFSAGQAFDGRLISVVVGAHALLTTACICYASGATPHTLHKQALHYILFQDVKRCWCWSTVVVGVGSFMPNFSCARSAAAELRPGICAAPSAALVATGSFSLICVRYKAARYKIHSQSPEERRPLASNITHF